MRTANLQRPPSAPRYAFVGTGHRAELYFAALLGPHSDAGIPAALCDVNTTRMAYYNDLWRAARPAADPLPTYHANEFSRMLDRERPDALVVTTVDSTHHAYIIEALSRGCDVVVEKPLATTAEQCADIAAAAERSDADLVLTFNYRYAPRNSAVKELLSSGAVGDVTSVHFEWLLDTVHGADYFRRWHRVKDNSGGLLVHKASHHFDLVNWWLNAVPQTVSGLGDLRFYGSDNARVRGTGHRHHRSHGAPDAAGDPFALPLAADERLKRLYLDAEHEDGYLRDLDVFGEGITIEDTMAVLVSYANRAMLTYSLTAYAPWEGYRVAINGTAGRLELEVCERAEAVPAPDRSGGDPAHAGVDASVTAHSVHTGAGQREETQVRREGAELVLQRHWEPAQLIEVPEGSGGHGGGDDRLLHDIFRGAGSDPLGRQAGYIDGIRSVLVGVAANRSLASGKPVALTDFGLELTGPATGGSMPHPVTHIEYKRTGSEVPPCASQ